METSVPVMNRIGSPRPGNKALVTACQLYDIRISYHHEKSKEVNGKLVQSSIIG